MPKSKRNKVVPLTQVKKRGLEAKEELVQRVTDALDHFKYSYVLSFDNIRSAPFKTMQSQMSDTTKFFLGKNKVMMKALGCTPESETADNTAKLSKYLNGQVCLCFSNLPPADLESKLAEFEIEDFAQSGVKATYDVFLSKGTDALDGYSHAMEPLLRQLGLPTRLNFQKIELLSDVYVAREGSALTVEQAKLLKLLGHKMAKFELKILVSRTTKGKIVETDHGKEYLALRAISSS